MFSNFLSNVDVIRKKCPNKINNATNEFVLNKNKFKSVNQVLNVTVGHSKKKNIVHLEKQYEDSLNTLILLKKESEKNMKNTFNKNVFSSKNKAQEVIDVYNQSSALMKKKF
ncbi:hypothetical protein D9V69_02920 [Buchnera aphidicola (Hyadaphis tataricae)]|uniref:Uncharacterized protein n=1 Tax=Buchnera aphidicola (Hyadaphis tataricae) TaxID=1241859 RepID=A0A4D6Y6V0_9GAMM|nr:hypothetical protein [Buchnera aphidicola]QCI21851.1 hypothetical protein D9V69_02920 [Buchnera aphidicola (Hyadaphis tataricae)]